MLEAFNIAFYVDFLTIWTLCNKYFAMTLFLGAKGVNMEAAIWDHKFDNYLF